MALIDTILGSNPVGALVSSGASLIGGAIQGHQNRKLQRQTNAQEMAMFNRQMQFNENEAQRNRDFQLHTMELQNEYNSPVNQRKLLQQAGYNPLMSADMAAQSASGLTGDTAQAPAAPSLTAPAFEQNLGADFISQLQRSRVIDASVQSASSDIALKTLQLARENATFLDDIDKKMYDSKTSKEQYGFWSAQKDLHRQMADTFADVQGATLENLKQQTAAIWTHAQNESLQTHIQFALQQLAQELQPHQIQEIQARIANIDADSLLKLSEKRRTDQLLQWMGIDRKYDKGLRDIIDGIFTNDYWKKLQESPWSTLGNTMLQTMPIMLYQSLQHNFGGAYK